jgi:hypothetical protein
MSSLLCNTVPPPESRQDSGRWANLPQINRQRLLRLLSHLLERQLEPSLASSKEDNDERNDNAE